MIKLQGYFQGFNSKVDGSASLRFTTNELDAESFAELKRNLNAFGWILFQESSVPDIPKEQPEEEGKSSSKRLYDRLYVYWKKKGIEQEFETWRRGQMDKIGLTYLEKLQ